MGRRSNQEHSYPSRARATFQKIDGARALPIFSLPGHSRRLQLEVPATKKTMDVKVILAPLLLLIGGLALAITYRDAPRFSEEWASTVPENDSATYYRIRDSHENPLAKRADWGRGLASLAASLLATVALLRVRRFSDFASLETPQRRWLLFVAMNVSLYGYVFAGARWIRVLTYERLDFPPWGDQGIMLAPGFLTLFGILAGPIANIVLVGVLRGTHLPLKLWAVPRRTSAYIATALVALLVAPFVLELCYHIALGDQYTVPFTVLGIYTLLCARAAMVAPGASLNDGQQKTAITTPRAVPAGGS